MGVRAAGDAAPGTTAAGRPLDGEPLQKTDRGGKCSTCQVFRRVLGTRERYHKLFDESFTMNVWYLSHRWPKGAAVRVRAVDGRSDAAAGVSRTPREGAPDRSGARVQPFARLRCPTAVAPLPIRLSSALSLAESSAIAGVPAGAAASSASAVRASTAVAASAAVSSVRALR